MKQSSPRPAGGGKPFPKFSHPPWPCLGSGWSRTSTPVPWPLIHSVTWVGRRKEICFSSLASPPQTESGIYSGTVRLGLAFLHLLFSLSPTGSAGGMEMPSCCWSEQRGLPSLWRAPRGCVWGGWGTKGLPQPELPRHGSGDVPSPWRAKACPGAPASSSGIWGFLQAHLWCWDLTGTHAAS